MIYGFELDVAKEYGVDEAIMITNFQYWIMKNKAGNKHFYDGHYWTYNSSKAFAELFPFWNQRHIELILNHLVDKGVLIKGNFNQSAYDRTSWYAFNDEDKWLLQKKEMRLQKNVNGDTENCKAIPDNKPNNKPNNNNNNIYLYNNINNIYAENEIVEGWNKIAKKWQLPTISLLTYKRKSKLLKILQKYKYTLEDFYGILEDRIKKSLFLQGVVQKRDGSGGYIFEHSAKWHCDFDFFLQESSFVKTVDNTYTDGDLLK
jgi:hypothetical protein